MKLQVFLLAILMIACGSTKEMVNGKVKGNGKIITKEINISDYESVEIGSGISSEGNVGKKGIPTFNYKQTKRKASLEVTTDSNILPLLEIKCSKGKLTISSKDRSTRLVPTRFVIEGTSQQLAQLTISGAMDFYVVDGLSGENLNIKVSGSSDVYLMKTVRVDNCEFDVSGSGDLKAENLQTQYINCKVSGSGDINLKGEANEGKFAVSGSGDIKGFDFPVRNLECSVSGSGDIRVNATHKLEARASGSGDIHYKGDATVNKRTSGSGDIHRAR